MPTMIRRHSKKYFGQRLTSLFLLCSITLLLSHCAHRSPQQTSVICPDFVPPSQPSGWPVSLPAPKISSPFGMRRHPHTGQMRLHKGIDIPGPYGTPIHSTAPGHVTFSGVQGNYGHIVVIDHGHGITTAYAHLDKRLVETGDTVRRGQSIGQLGKSGNATGPHIHYEVRQNNTPIDPTPYLH